MSQTGVFQVPVDRFLLSLQVQRSLQVSALGEDVGHVAQGDAQALAIAELAAQLGLLLMQAHGAVQVTPRAR